MIEIITGVAAGIFSIFKSIAFVREGESGVLLTWGRASRDKTGKIKLISPGFKFQIPFVQKVERIHLAKNTASYWNLCATLPSGLSYTFDAFITYHVKTDPEAIEHLLFRMEDKDEFIRVVFESILQRFMIRNNVESSELDARAMDELNLKFEENGMIVDDVGIMNFIIHPTAQHLKAIDYKIEKSIQWANQPLPILCAALGAIPIIPNNHATDDAKHYIESTDESLESTRLFNLGL